MKGLLILAALAWLVGMTAQAQCAVVAPLHGPSPDRIVRIDVDKDALFWQSIMNSDNPDDYQAYLEQFPGGTYAALARTRLVKLMAGQKLDFTEPGSASQFKQSFFTSCAAAARSHLSALGLAITSDRESEISGACGCSSDGVTDVLVKREPMTLSELADAMKHDPEIAKITAACRAKYIKRP